MPTRGTLVVISGPSGVGKSTVVRRVLAETDASYSVSATTRGPRVGEQHGRDYYFLDEPAFRRMIEQDELLEWAEVFGNFYGTPAQPVQEQLIQGRSVVLEIDVQGGVQVARRCPEAVCVLILPPDDQTLAQRLAGRNTDTPDVIARRLAKARQEIQTARESGAYKYEVVNDDLDEAVAQVVEIITKEAASND